jgi:hypothetical protein
MDVKCSIWSSLKVLSETFLAPADIYIVKRQTRAENCVGFHIKCPYVLSDFRKTGTCRQLLGKLPNIILYRSERSYKT